ncbi:MAG: RNA polymerase sigma factor [Phycisphaerae bacterium]|nr:RNA polymerase sigma factor [Phycisphaerae bacterium]
MSEHTDYIQLVRQAQQGHPESRAGLLRLVEPRLAQYVGRLTLDHDLTAEIVQDSIAEMLRILGTLKDPQRFWCWLYTITLNKLRAHYRQQWHHKEKPLSEVEQEWLQAREQDVLAELVTQELKQIVVRAVAELEPHQRAVLTMRCYEQMSYSQISEAMGCTQLGARAMFYRAKKSMARLLNSHGIDKTALPIALLVFGKLSATSEAAAASISITASTLRVGPWAVLAVAATRHSIVTALIGVAALGTGGLLAGRSAIGFDDPRQAIVLAEIDATRAVSQNAPCWYYYPPGSGEAVLIRTGGRTIAYSQWLQEQQANFYRQGDTIHIRNHRQFAPDLAAWRLPTDPPALRSFLQAQDHGDPDLQYVASSSRGLLVAVEQAQAGRPRQATLNYDVSREDYFRHDWSARAAIVDERDELHRIGWAQFTVSGRIGDRNVSGFGRLPFTADAADEHGPWLELALGDNLMLLDSGTAGQIRDGSGEVLARYSGGSFFQGLGRPWTGLHTIDTIRRDAALAGIAFTTTRRPDGHRAQIVLDAPGIRLTYRVHLYQDWIESIAFSREGVTIGELTFRYPKPDEAGPHRLTASSSPPSRQGQTRVPHGLWLMRLAQGSLTP